jgi:adenylosuccinate lyase
MQRNLDQLGGLIFSQRILLALTQKGMIREDAYQAVQRNAMKVWENGQDFQAALAADIEVVEQLDFVELAELFDPDYHTKHVELIFERVFGN